MVLGFAQGEDIPGGDEEEAGWLGKGPVDCGGALEEYVDL